MFGLIVVGLILVGWLLVGWLLVGSVMPVPGLKFVCSLFLKV